MPALGARVWQVPLRCRSVLLNGSCYSSCCFCGICGKCAVPCKWAHTPVRGAASWDGEGRVPVVSSVELPHPLRGPQGLTFL